MAKGDELIAKILRGDGDVGVLANDLLREFGRGYPLGQLAKLLDSKNEEARHLGVWVASELGSSAAPFVHKIATFLDHPDARIRIDAIDSVLTCSTANDDKVVAGAILHLNDSHAGVRWKSMLFLVQQSDDLLLAALDFFKRQGGHDVHVKGLGLLTSDTGEIRRKAATYMNDEDSILRKYGVAAAARIAREDRSLLKSALLSPDEELKEFAISVAKINGINLD